MTDAKSRGRVAGSRGRREEGRDIEKKLSGLVKYRIARREEEEAGRREQAKTHLLTRRVFKAKRGTTTKGATRV